MGKEVCDSRERLHRVPIFLTIVLMNVPVFVLIVLRADLPFAAIGAWIATFGVAAATAVTAACRAQRAGRKWSLVGMLVTSVGVCANAATLAAVLLSAFVFD